MVWPSLISVSVTPGSAARAGPVIKQADTNSAPANASILNILPLPAYCVLAPRKTRIAFAPLLSYHWSYQYSETWGLSILGRCEKLVHSTKDVYSTVRPNVLLS